VIFLARGLPRRYIDDHYQVKTAPVSFSYPLDMGPEVRGFVGDLSMRHAAVAAGLGVFGRNNLVIHPRFGTRVIFTAILTGLPLNSDPPVQEELCTQCGLCVEACPGQALDEEGKTEMLKCLKVSRPAANLPGPIYWISLHLLQMHGRVSGMHRGIERKRGNHHV